MQHHTDLHERDLGQLVAGIVEDARDLVETEVDVVKDHVGERLRRTETMVLDWIVTAALGMVAAVLIALAIAESLVALGLARWAAHWIVAAIAGAVVAIFVGRARAAGRAAARIAAAPVLEPQPGPE